MLRAMMGKRGRKPPMITIIAEAGCPYKRCGIDLYINDKFVDSYNVWCDGTQTYTIIANIGDVIKIEGHSDMSIDQLDVDVDGKTVISVSGGMKTYTYTISKDCIIELREFDEFRAYG